MGQRVRALREEVAAWASVPASVVNVVRSPYRFCPLGAHVDHQLGKVTGLALDRALLMAFVPRDEALMVVRSRQFPGTAQVPLDRAPLPRTGDWADYARGAAYALQKGFALRRGLTALVDGHDNVGGLSSSAAAGVAYLLALEAVNGALLPPAENVKLDRVIENEYIGLDNGVLDQSVILLSRSGHLTYLDCQSGESRLVRLGGGEDVSIAVLFSGLSKPLSGTDYNLRVQECRQAAAHLLQAAHLPVPVPAFLRAVPPEVFVHHGHALPAELQRRAAHFFAELARVRQGADLWAKGDLEGFGRLMSESGLSSIENYECGNCYLRTAYEVLRGCPGVYGARFSGGGFRGCCVALLRPGCEEKVARAALSRYLKAHGDMAGRAQVYFCRSGEGAGFLS
jgi:galactokinase/galacturonokinase